MARTEAVEPSAAKRTLLSGFRLPRQAAVSGHARLLARPAYQRLLAAEPLLRRLIPVLIVIFLLIVGLARFVELYLQGRLHLDDLISRRIKLEDVNDGLEALKTGEVARSVIMFD